MAHFDTAQPNAPHLLLAASPLARLGSQRPLVVIFGKACLATATSCTLDSVSRAPPDALFGTPARTLPRPSRARLLGCCCSVIRASLLAPLHLTSSSPPPTSLPPHLNLTSTSFTCLDAKFYLSSHCHRIAIDNRHFDWHFSFAAHLQVAPRTLLSGPHTLGSVLRLASTSSSLGRLALDSRIPVSAHTPPSSASPAYA